MPFNRKNFAPIGGQATRGGGPETSPGAPQRFSYRSQDDHETVDTAQYFAAVRPLLVAGDIIDVVVVNNAGNVVSYGQHIVRVSNATMVDVVNVTAGVVTNTD